MTPRAPAERYLPEHLHEALLADERVGEQDLQVRADEHCIHVTGTVADGTPAATPSSPSIAELAPGWEICNDVELRRRRAPAPMSRTSSDDARASRRRRRRPRRPRTPIRSSERRSCSPTTPRSC